MPDSESVHHSPGPWHRAWTNMLRDGHAIEICSGKGDEDGSEGIGGVYNQTPESEANAALIVAAPEMLAALKATVPLLGLAAYNAHKANDVEAEKRYVQTGAAVQAVIAKALGVSAAVATW